MKKYIYSFLISLFFSLHTFSQSVEVTNFMRLNPYSNLNNPAYFIPYNGYVGIPGVSNINFSFYNTGLLYKNLIATDKNGYPKTVTLNKFINSLHPKSNWFNTELDLELLGFGFRIQDYFFSFGYRLKMDQCFKYSQDLFKFLLQGNLAQNEDGSYLYTEATPAKLEVNPNINIYQEMSIGFQGRIFDWLYVGARPKILYGLVNIKTNKLGASVYTNPEDYTISGNHDININVASIVPFYTGANGIAFDTESFYFGNIFKNVGFAIDLGAVYRINQQIRVSASVTDLGFIKWKGKGSVLNIASNPLANSFEFSGFTTDQILNFIQNGINFNLDTIFKVVNNSFVLNELKAYTTMLTSKIMLDGYFDLTPSNRFILQFKGYIMGKNFLPQFTVAYNGSFFNVIDVVVSYSMMRKNFANLGLGLGFRMGSVHLYTGTDNILAAVNIFNATRTNATFGLLVNFPTRPKVKEAELRSLFRQKEEMLEVEGVKE